MHFTDYLNSLWHLYRGDGALCPMLPTSALISRLIAGKAT